MGPVAIGDGAIDDPVAGFVADMVHQHELVGRLGQRAQPREVGDIDGGGLDTGWQVRHVHHLATEAGGNVAISLGPAPIAV